MKSRRSLKCYKYLLFLFNFIFWLIGVVLASVGIWLLVDPRRNYVLNFVILSEHEPILNYASFIFVGVGVGSILIGFLGCCGTLREIQSMISLYVALLILVLLGELISGLLGVLWYTKFSTLMPYYLYNMTVWRYGREKWATELVDTFQFYQKCCGYNGTRNYLMSYWQITYSGGVLYNVPQSCCVQRQEAYPPDNIQPVDDWCQLYEYNSTGQLSSVYTGGCYDKLMTWFGETSLIFMVAGFSSALIQVVGILLSICLCKQIGRIYEEYTSKEPSVVVVQSSS